MRILTNILFWLGLTIWIAMVTAPGITGMSAFPVLMEEGARIDRFADYFKDDQDAMSRVVAGFVAGRVFLVTDSVQWVLGPLVVLLGLFSLRPMRLYAGPLAWVGMMLLIGALALTIWHNAVMGPGMADDLQTYRAAAEAGDHDSAERAKASFDVDHKTAERLFGLRWCLLIGSVAGFAGGQRKVPRKEAVS